MHRIVLLAFLQLMSLCIFAQPSARIKVNIPEGPTPWNHLDFNYAENQFQFAIVTDRTGGHRPGVFPTAISKLNILQPEFVMSVGDMIEGYTVDKNELNRQWQEFNGFIDSLQMPFFYVPGNHDITNPVMKTLWEERFGPTYYHFVYQDVLFMCLNSEEAIRGAGRGAILQPQLDYIQKTLEENEDVRWTLVFMHQPLWNQQNPELWPEVEKLLATRKHTVFVGHNHEYVRYERNNGKYFILATTGGGSGLRGPNFGEFDHVVWVTMTDEGPILANLLLEGIWEEDVVTQDWASVMHPLGRRKPISIEPMILEESQFEKGSNIFTLKNDSDIPMTVSLQPHAHSQLMLGVSHTEIQVNPNSREEVSLNLLAETPLNPDQILPIELDATVRYQVEGRPELEMSFPFKFKPISFYDIANADIKLDGKLDEWGQLSTKMNQQTASLEATPFSHKGDNDLSYAFDVKSDDKFIYVGIEVIDDEINNSETRNPYEEDGIALLLDARPLNVSVAANGIDWGEMMLILASPGKEEVKLFRKERLPEGTQVKFSTHDKGYQAEIAIPMSFLDEKQNGSWETFRLNLGVNDFDNDFKHKTGMFYVPQWNSKENIFGSGMFRKTANDTANR